MSIFAIKILALITMLIDHVGEFFPKIPYVLILRQIGRISAPLFLFASAYGIRYTSSPKKYIRRIYFLSVIMSLGNSLLTFLMPDYSIELTNNFPATIFLIACICLIYNVRKNGGNWQPYMKNFILFQFLSLPLLLFTEKYFPVWGEYVVNGVYPSIFTCEGGITFVFLGFIIYCFCEEPKKLTVAYLIFCGFYLASECILMVTLNINLSRLFTENVQWMMVFSLGFMLMYNKKKGYSGKFSKYLFYIFYPIHIWIFYIISYTVNHIN